jgi:hypothetical protein
MTKLDPRQPRRISLENKIAIILIIGAILASVVLLIPNAQDEISWRWALHKNDADGYATYLEHWHEGRHVAEASVLFDDCAWADALKTNTVQSYQDYLQKRLTEKHQADAKDFIDTLLWQSAVNTKTVEAFEDYIRQAKNGKHAAEAKGLIDDRNYALAAQEAGIGPPSKLIAYIEHFPEGRHIDEAKGLLDDQAYAAAVEKAKAGDLQGLQTYIGQSPSPKHQKQAAVLLDDSSFTIARDAAKDQADALSAYLANFPTGRHIDEAKGLLDDHSFADTAKNDVGALMQYLAHFPNGRHVKDANQLLDDQAYAAAVDKAKAGSLESIREYMNRSPAGAHNDEAKSLLDQLDDESFKLARDAGNDQTKGLVKYQQDFPNGRHGTEAARLARERLAANAATADLKTFPATNPVTTQPSAMWPSHVAVVPSGFHEMAIGSRSFICRPEDESWIRVAVAAIAPETRPTTMPVDILQTIAQQRGPIFKQIAAELGLSDSIALGTAFDKEMIPPLKKLRDVNPRVYYFPITRADLVSLMESGWSDPRYEYLSSTKDVHYIEHVDIALDRQPDDVVIWANIQDADSVKKRSQTLASKIMEYEGPYSYWESGLAQTGVRHVMTAFLRSEVTSKLNLPDSLSWFGVGLSNVYGVKYSELIAGTPARDAIGVILKGDPRNPLAWRQLDLTHPLNRDSIRPEYVPYYVDAAEHKGTFIVQQWANLARKDSLVKMLVALRKKPPTNPDELAQTVKAASGIDIKQWMLPDFQTK